MLPSRRAAPAIHQATAILLSLLELLLRFANGAASGLVAHCSRPAGELELVRLVQLTKVLELFEVCSVPSPAMTGGEGGDREGFETGVGCGVRGV